MASARFTFIGTFEVNDKDEASKGYFLREGKTKKGDPYQSINLQVVQEKNNRSFVECFGMQSSKIQTLDTNMKKTEIKWDDRFDEDVVKDVANFKKTVVKIGDERREFIASYDAISYIVKNLNELKGKTVIVSGQRKKNEYNGKVSDRFEFSSIKTVDDEDTKKRLTVNMELLFDKESFDINDWEKERKLYINGWTDEYMSDVKENRYVPQQIIFDCSKIDLNNEKHRGMVKFRLKMLGCELTDDNKILVKVKAKKLYNIGIITNFINGQEQVEFDKSMLTERQKEALELGLKTLDEMRPSGTAYGERVLIYKLRDFDMRTDGKYTEGYIVSELTQDEFDEKLYKVAEPASIDDLVDDNDELPFGDTKKSDEDEDDEDDLFG